MCVCECKGNTAKYVKDRMMNGAGDLREFWDRKKALHLVDFINEQWQKVGGVENWELEGLLDGCKVFWS